MRSELALLISGHGSPVCVFMMDAVKFKRRYCHIFTYLLWPWICVRFSGGPSSGGRCRRAEGGCCWSSAALPAWAWAALCVWAPPSVSPPPLPLSPFWPPAEVTTWPLSPALPPGPWKACAASWGRWSSASGPSWHGRRHTASPGARSNSCVGTFFRPRASWLV